MEDRDVVRAFLETDPIATSTVWDRVYQQPAYTDVRLDGLPGGVEVERLRAALSLAGVERL